MENLKAYVLLLLSIVIFIVISVPAFIFGLSILIIAIVVRIVTGKNIITMKIT